MFNYYARKSADSHKFIESGKTVCVFCLLLELIYYKISLILTNSLRMAKMLACFVSFQELQITKFGHKKK